MKIALVLAALSLACASVVTPAAVAGDAAESAGTSAGEEVPKEIIAVQIRRQGYTCDKPQNAKREKPQLGDDVWILECENARYRVRLVPDMAATVERLD